jgi:hypothetical protein
MAKIDRLGWAAGSCAYAYGLRIGVRVNSAEMLQRVEQRLPPGWEPGCSPLVDVLYSLKVGKSRHGGKVREYSLLYAGAQQLARTMDLDAALDSLESHLQVYVAEWSRNRVFVHAGVVAWQGRAILMPGRTMSGKSTLVAALLRAGATYYSDEYAVLDARGQVYPYARRLSLRQPEGKPNERWTAQELGADTGSAPLPVSLIAVTRHQADGRWQPRKLSTGQTVLELMRNTVAAEREPEMVLGPLERASRQGRSLTSVRGEADETATAILREVERQEL